MDLSFYKGKRVLVTGHTGFKGSWMCRVLLREGAEVAGYSLEPQKEQKLFKCLNLNSDMASVTGDVRNLEDLLKAFKTFNVKGAIICESPNIEEDCKLLKDYYQSL